MTPDALFGAGVEDFKQAEWLAEKMKNEWRFDFSEEKWHNWNSKRWALDKTNQVMRTVAELAATGIGETNSEVIRKALIKLLSNNPIERALDSLATLDGYGTDGSDWDQDPFLLGVENGIVDLRENALISRPSKDMLVTRSTGVRFEPISGPKDFESVAPHFMEFLLEVTSDYDWTPDPSMASFLLLWFGASLFGMMPEQRFLMLTGSGRNGKGALRHAIMQAVGAEYGMQPDANLYSRSRMGPARSNEARADLMALKGKRIAFFSEPDRGQFNEEMLKAHTGGDIITARGLYQRIPVSWEPTHSITFLVNDAPALEDVGPSMGSRIMVADFRHRFEGSAEDKNLYPTLASERKGILSILAWAAQAWHAAWSGGSGGITLPDRVTDQSKQFIERNDPVAEALREVFNVEPSLTSNGQAAYDAYRDWHNKAGRDDDPMSMVKFSLALEKKGFQKFRTTSARGWKGLRPLGAMDLAERGDDDDEE